MEKPLGAAGDHCWRQFFETFGAFCSKNRCVLLCPPDLIGFSVNFGAWAQQLFRKELKFSASLFSDGSKPPIKGSWTLITFESNCLVPFCEQKSAFRSLTFRIRVLS